MYAAPQRCEARPLLAAACTVSWGDLSSARGKSNLRHKPLYVDPGAQESARSHALASARQVSAGREGVEGAEWEWEGAQGGGGSAVYQPSDALAPTVIHGHIYTHVYIYIIISYDI